MFCKKCGTQLADGDMFCKNCGERVEELVNPTPEVKQEVVEPQVAPVEEIKQEEVVETPVAPLEEVKQKIVETPVTPVEEIRQEPTVEPQATTVVTPKSEYVENVEAVQVENEKKVGALTIASIVVGVVSIVLAYFITVLGVLGAVIGIILAAVDKVKSKLKIVGIVLNVIAIVVAVIMLIVGMVKLFDTVADSIGNTTSGSYEEEKGVLFEGDGFTVEYNYKWSKVTMAGGNEGLKYLFGSKYLVPVGTSAYNHTTNQNFSTKAGRDKLYDNFVDFWNSEYDEEEDNVRFEYYEDTRFTILKDDIYYGKVAYGLSKDNLKGYMYLIVSEDKNVIVSFMSNSDKEDVQELDEATMELFKTIELTDKYVQDKEDNILYDDAMADFLESMTNWNQYPEARSGELGKVNNIKGGWRILNLTDEYWYFKGNEFWWYQSMSNLNDNYWYGTTKIYQGKEAMRMLGLDEKNLEDIVRKTGRISENDVYAVICTPKKIISGGVDKSDTNIPEGAEFKHLWVLVDHGKEGIEGQVANMTGGNWDVYYYVKVED